MNKWLFKAAVFIVSTGTGIYGYAAREGGGLPISVVSADVNYKCEAEQGIYIIKESVRRSGQFKQSFDLIAKKGEQIAMGPMAVAYIQNDTTHWVLDQSKSENVDMALFTPYLTKKHYLHIETNPLVRPIQYQAMMWLGTEDPNEIFTGRTIDLSRDFDLEVFFKIRKPDFYLSHTLKITCVVTQ